LALLSVARARLALLTGANEDALALTTSVAIAHQPSDDTEGQSDPRSLHPKESSQSQRHTSPVYRLEGMVIRSIALQRLGVTTEAADLLRRAVNQATHLGCLLPLASAPRHELHAVAERVPSAQRLLKDRAFTSMPDIYPSHLTLVTLTERERTILRMLDDGRQPRDIARSLYVSPNTVKTQTRSLYRKLHAASRGQALATARELQILPPSTR
jgi:LuxR family transcriptional regulator, maltose regulon positive regulatory protein